jgi:predicted metalloprotease with PDZ domain
MLPTYNSLYIKYFLTLIILLSLLNVSHSQSSYRFTTDLVTVRKDKIKITLFPPAIDKKEIIYVIPEAVPGSYASKKYGRFITKFSAYASDGNKLKVRIEENRDFIIENADKLNRIEYWVNDTRDDRDGTNPVFQAGGSNIEKGKNFVINPFAYYGYFDGIQQLPYEITIQKPAHFYGSTNLKKENISETNEKLSAKNYLELTDNPVMYCAPDTISFPIDENNIYISVYSASGKVNSKEIKKHLLPLMTNISKYAGMLVPDEYHFIFYFNGGNQKVFNSSNGLSGYGALEHKNSSFYFLPEPTFDIDLKSSLLSICSHEFLHTLTPLHLRSKEVADFNFRYPKMSQHLWLYEGVTEYFSQQCLLQSGLITEQDFYETMAEKIQSAAAFPLFSMTEMSSNVLLPKQQENYLSVYSRGALLAWYLDMQIISLSNGANSLKNVILNLADKYPPDQPFDDAKLFDELISMTNPGLRIFFDDYIKGMKAVNINDMLALSGLKLLNDMPCDIYKSGPIELRFFSDKKEIRLMNENNYFGFNSGDVLLAINKMEIGTSNLYRLFKRYFVQNTSPSPIELTIKRDGNLMSLEFTPIKRNENVSYLIIPFETSNELQTRVRKIISGSF